MPWRRGQSYSQDLRDRVLAAVDGGVPVYTVARRFRVSVSYIYKALARRRRTGDSRPSANRGHRPRKLSAEQEAALAARVREEPDITLARLGAWLVDAHGVVISSGALWNAVDRLGLSFKKKASARPSRIAPTSPPSAACGGRPSGSLTPSAWCSSTRPG